MVPKPFVKGTTCTAKYCKTLNFRSPFNFANLKKSRTFMVTSIFSSATMLPMERVVLATAREIMLVKRYMCTQNVKHISSTKFSGSGI